MDVHDWWTVSEAWQRISFLEASNKALKQENAILKSKNKGLYESLVGLRMALEKIGRGTSSPSCGPPIILSREDLQDMAKSALRRDNE